ncbi:MAG: lysylphosphatidylglycerol synthase transmembrane domain-containing protein [Pyramidobacter sp.]|nr:lysylphosphatidylglycerol synthase transmembrane domain-containing protein [Pyramidobacter sp.]
MSLRKGLGLFLFLTLGVSALIVMTSIDKNAVYILRHAQKIFIVYILGLVFLAWSCDALRFCMTAKAMGHSIPFVRGLVLTWLHYFGCALTPMQVGGGPFQVYVLYKSGIPIGSGIAITLIRTLFSTFLLSIAAPAAFFLRPELVKGHFLVKGVFFYVGALSIVMWSAFIVSVVKPQLIKNFLARSLLFLKKFKCLRNLKVHFIYRRICSEIDSYSENVRHMVGPGFKYFLCAAVLSVFHLLSLFSVLPMLIRAVGMAVDYFLAILAQGVFMFILYFVPTPGASGVAEGGGAAVFSLLVPWNIAGIMTVLWRFFTEYLAIFMGCIVAIRLIGWGTAEKIISGEHEAGKDEECGA